MTKTALWQALIESGAHKPAERIKKDFFKCVTLSWEFRKLFEKPPKSERALTRLIEDYCLFATWYNTGSRSINQYQEPDDLYKFPEDFVELAQLFWYKNTNIDGAWNFLVSLLNHESVTWVYVPEKIEFTTEHAIFGTLALVKIILDTKDNDEKRELLAYIREILSSIGGNAKAIQYSWDKKEFKHLSQRIQKQLWVKWMNYDEHDIIQILQKILPSIT